MTKASNKIAFWAILLTFLVVAICTLVMQIPKAHANSLRTETVTEFYPVKNEILLERTSCRLGDKEFELAFTSPTGDVLEDDTTLWFVQSGQAVKANPGKPGYIALFADIPKSTLICQAAAVFELSKGYLAVPLYVSNRPGLNLLSVAVYDLKNNKVLEYAILEKYYGENPKLRPIKRGFSYMAVSAQPNDSTEGLVETWLDITWNGKKLVQKWDRTLSKVRH
jgi:hypothetical protein